MNKELVDIAKRHLTSGGDDLYSDKMLAILTTRYNDSPDFHDCSVVQIRAALEAAFNAGRASVQN